MKTHRVIRMILLMTFSLCLSLFILTCNDGGGDSGGGNNSGGGGCTNTCQNSGDKQCYTNSAYQVCGNYDSDPCLEWGSAISCGTGENCNNGNCEGPVCSDNCSPSGAKQCSGTTGFMTCGNYDGDSCLEWSSVTNCGATEACSNGDCVSTCVDNDGDNYYPVAGCGTEIDCDDSNPSKHPGATEICGDGIDQDCSGSDLGCTPCDYDVDSNTIALWHFNEGSGSVVTDSSGNNFNGTQQIATWTSSGKCDGAIVNSANSTIKVLNSTGINIPVPFSIEMWLYPTSTGQTMALIDKQNGGGVDIEIQADNRISIFLENIGGASSSHVTTNPVITANQWQNISVTYNGASLKIYKNFSLVEQWSESRIQDQTTNDLGIGYDVFRSDSKFIGTIDEVRISNIARTYGSCSDECSPSGTKQCSGNGYQTCGNYDADACLEWSSVTACPGGQTCSNGTCSFSCSDECSPSGSKQCSGNGYQTCGNYDADACLEWSSVTACTGGQTCSNGNCTTTCSNDCSPSGSKQCSGNGYQTCGNYDADACLEWSSVTSCSSGQICSGGNCICPDNDGDGYQSNACGGTDCNDSNSSIHPGATEICDNKDNNCVNGIDEQCDVDNDNYCNQSKTCVGTPTTCTGGCTDCNDNNANVNPGATEVCNNINDDCDLFTDEPYSTDEEPANDNSPGVLFAIIDKSYFSVNCDVTGCYLKSSPQYPPYLGSYRYYSTDIDWWAFRVTDYTDLNPFDETFYIQITQVTPVDPITDYGFCLYKGNADGTGLQNKGCVSPNSSNIPALRINGTIGYDDGGYYFIKIDSGDYGCQKYEYEIRVGVPN